MEDLSQIRSNKFPTPLDRNGNKLRWSPKREQIDILESLYNRGVINPPNDETTRIRQVLETFGPISDTNVFYWFQNRRTRTRRRQRQLAVEAAEEKERGSDSATPTTTVVEQQQEPPTQLDLGIGRSCASGETNNFGVGVSVSDFGGFPSSSLYFGSSSQVPSQMGYQEINQPNYGYYPDQGPTCPQQPAIGGIITVYINGVVTQVPNGPINLRGMFGEDVCLVHYATGITLPINQFGFLMNTLDHGDSYLLVSRST